MSLTNFIKSMDDGLYKEAKAFRGTEGERVDVVDYFGAKAEEAGVALEGQEKAAREQEFIARFNVQPGDASRLRRVKKHAADTWIVDQFFKEAKVCQYSDTVEKAFQVTTAQVVFPIYYSNQIQAGILANPLLDVLVSDTIPVNSGTADHATMNETQADRTSGAAGEFTTFNEVTISATNAPIKLQKFGRILNMSDEAVRRVRIPVLARGLERIGRQLAIDMTDFALETIIAGDGNAGTATTVAAATSASPVYSDWVKLITDVTIGYELSDMIFGQAILRNLLNTPEFKDPLAGFSYQNNGAMPKPFGLNTHRWDSAGATSYATTKVVAIQRDLCLIAYTEGGLLNETDRLLNGQFARNASSIWIGYGNWDGAARRVGTGWS